MFYKLILILVRLQVAAALAPSRRAVLVALQSTEGFEEAKNGTRGHWKPPKVHKKDAVLTPNRSAILAELMHLEVYEAKVAELKAYRDQKLEKKAAKLQKKAEKKAACKPPINGTYVVKTECHTRMRVIAMVKSSKEHIAAVMRKPHTTGANRVRLSRLKENSKNITTKADVKVLQPKEINTTNSTTKPDVSLSRPKENSTTNSTAKAESVVKCRNQFCCRECSGKHKSHTGPWYKCYGECDKIYPVDRLVAQAA